MEQQHSAPDTARTSPPHGTVLCAVSPAETSSERLLGQLAERAEAQGLTVVRQAETLDDDDVAARVRSLLESASHCQWPLVVIGAELGAYVALLASSTLEPDGLFLLSPVIGRSDLPNPYPAPTSKQLSIVHDRRSESVSEDDLYSYAHTHGAELHLLAGRLGDAPVREQVLDLFGRFLEHQLPQHHSHY